MGIDMGLFLLYFCGSFFKIEDSFMSCWWNLGFKEGEGGGVGMFLSFVFLVVVDDDNWFDDEIDDCCCEDKDERLDCFNSFFLFDDEVKLGYWILFIEVFWGVIFFGGDWIEL